MMRKGRGQAMQNRRSRDDDESSHMDSSEDEAGSAEQRSDSADEFAPSSDDNDSAKIKPQTKRPSLTNNEKKQQGLKRKQPISWEDSSSSSREEGESNKKTASSKPQASSPLLSETKKQPSKVKSPHKVRPPMSSGKVSASTSSEKAVVSPISSYDILYPTHLGMLGESGGSSECTLLLQIDSGPNLDTGGPSFDLTGAVGTIGRFETMNDSQNSNRGR
jgi:hypothetical protein